MTLLGWIFNKTDKTKSCLLFSVFAEKNTKLLKPAVCLITKSLERKMHAVSSEIMLQ